MIGWKPPTTGRLGFLAGLLTGLLGWLAWLGWLSRSKLKSLKSSPMEFMKAWSSSWGSKSGMKLSKSAPADCGGGRGAGGAGKLSGVSWGTGGGRAAAGLETAGRDTELEKLVDTGRFGGGGGGGWWTAGDWSAFFRGG